MKWFHWVILVCVAVAGLLVWLYMLGAKSEDINKKMEAVRAAKALKKIEDVEPEQTEVKPDESNP